MYKIIRITTNADGYYGGQALGQKRNFRGQSVLKVTANTDVCTPLSRRRRRATTAAAGIIDPSCTRVPTLQHSVWPPPPPRGVNALPFIFPPPSRAHYVGWFFGRRQINLLSGGRETFGSEKRGCSVYTEIASDVGGERNNNNKGRLHPEIRTKTRRFSLRTKRKGKKELYTALHLSVFFFFFFRGRGGRKDITSTT